MLRLLTLSVNWGRDYEAEMVLKLVHQPELASVVKTLDGCLLRQNVDKKVRGRTILRWCGFERRF